MQFSFEIISALPSVSTNDIQWYFTKEGTNNTTLLPSDDSTHYQFSEDRLTLRIINITRAGDSGNYSVTASNIVGQSTAMIVLDVQSRFIADYMACTYILSLSITRCSSYHNTAGTSQGIAG